MKILSQYFVKESIGPFIFGLAVITLVLVMDYLVDIMNLIIDRGIKIGLVLELFGLNLAWMLALAVPMAVLVSALMVFGRFSSDNELTACKACGISFFRLSMPLLGASFALTLVMIWFNDRILPEANHRARMLMSDITMKKPTWSLEENIFLDYFEGYSIRVKTVARKTSEISDIIIIQTKNSDRIITAERGLMYFSDDGSMFILELEEGEILEIDSRDPAGYTRTEFTKQTIAIPGASSDLHRTESSGRGDREMPISTMKSQNKERLVKLQSIQAEADSLVNKSLNKILSFASFYADSTSSKNRNGQTSKNYDNDVIKQHRDIQARLLFLNKTSANYKKEINSMEVEIQKKYSIPAACIAFMLIGAPLGSLARKGGFATGIGLSIFFFIIYWAFLITGEQMADSGKIPAFWAMWSPNFILGAIGIVFSYVFVRQSSIISIIDRIQSLFWLKKAAADRNLK